MVEGEELVENPDDEDKEDDWRANDRGDADLVESANTIDE